jgi:hypothetical protein
LVTLRVTNPFVMSRDPNSVNSREFTDLVSLTSTVFVHQTVDTSAHTNYLISLVKEQFACDQAKTDNYLIVLNRCQYAAGFFLLLTDTSRFL